MTPVFTARPWILSWKERTFCGVAITLVLMWRNVLRHVALEQGKHRINIVVYFRLAVQKKKKKKKNISTILFPSLTSCVAYTSSIQIPKLQRSLRITIANWKFNAGEVQNNLNAFCFLDFQPKPRTWNNVKGSLEMPASPSAILTPTNSFMSLQIWWHGGEAKILRFREHQRQLGIFTDARQDAKSIAMWRWTFFVQNKP